MYKLNLHNLSQVIYANIRGNEISKKVIKWKMKKP